MVGEVGIFKEMWERELVGERKVGVVREVD